MKLIRVKCNDSRIAVRCYYQNGKTISTEINGTIEDARKYFLNKMINIGSGEKDNMQKCIRVEEIKTAKDAPHSKWYDMGYEYAQYGAARSYIPDWPDDKAKQEWTEGYRAYKAGKKINDFLPNYCKAYRRDTEECRTGCEPKNIPPRGRCPFDDDDEAIKNCPCYQESK
jgi:hypothetical protein